MSSPRRTQAKGGPPAYWSAADAAELAVLVDALVVGFWPHRGKPGFSEALGEAVAAIVDWRRGRILRARAAHLRAAQDMAEYERRLHAA